MVLLNEGFLHCTDTSLKTTKKKMARAISKNQLNDPGPSWPSCLIDITHCGKRRKCWLPEFSPFPTMFSEALFLRVVVW